MKFMFVETRYKGEIDVPDEVIEKLPKKIALFFTLQFLDSLPNIKKKIEDTGREVIVTKGKHTKYEGQIYGCNIEEFPGTDGFLYVGDGLFHPKALVLGNDMPVHVWDPINKKYSLLDRNLMSDELKRQKAAYSKFLMSKKIGVLITTKHGQSYYDDALALRDKYPEKEFYYVAMDTFDFSSLNDFSFIDVWVNTACPRIGWDDTKRADKPIVDLGTVL